MAIWVDQYLGVDVRVVCHLNEAPLAGSSPLKYTVEKDGEPDRGPFITFDAAMKVALGITTYPEMQTLTA